MIEVRRTAADKLEAAEQVRSLQFAEVRAVITRADGTVEDLGVIDSYESAAHELERAGGPATASRLTLAKRTLRRIGRKVLPIVSALAIAYGAATHRPQDALAPLGAATVITNGGQAIVTNLVSGIGGTVPKYVAWGTGAGTAAATDTTLFTESTDETRTSGTVSRVTTTVTNDTYQVVGQITVATSGKTITNVGLFDASTSGNLYFKSDFTGLALLVGDSITFTIKVKFS